MAKPKLQYDIEEVDEILDLYKKELRKENKRLTEYKSKSISKFNELLVDNNTKRKNGDSFTLYKYNFWAGKHRSTGNYNYGKKIIIEKNEELRQMEMKSNRTVEIQDIINIVNRNIKNPDEMKNLLCIYLKKEKDKIANLSKENIKLTNEVRELKNKNQVLSDTYTNLFFNSQNPNNSLNDMLSLTKIDDKFICDELESMFDDGLSRFNVLANLDYDSSLSTNNHSLQNIISLNEKKMQNQRAKELEDEGF